MPVRNFRYLGSTKITSHEDGTGVGELYDIYNQKNNNLAYPATLYVTSELDTNADFYGGENKDITFNLEGYFFQQTFTISIVFNGTAVSADFYDSAGTSVAVTPNTTTGLAVFTFTNVFKAATGAGITNDGDTFTVRLSASTNGIVYEKLCTIRQASFSIAPNSTSYNEGDQLTWTLTYSNFNAENAETLYWACTPDTRAPSGGTITSADLVSTNDSGTVTLPTGSGTVQINGPTLIADYTTEGTESVYIGVAFNSLTQISSRYIARVLTNVNDTSINPTATVTPSASSVNEGSSVTFTVSTTNFTSGVLPWEVVLGTNTEPADVNLTSGTVSISSSSGTVAITATSDGYTETGQGESFQLRVNHPTNGTQIGISSSVSINDTSTGTPEPAGIDITSSFYEYSNRHIDSNIYMGTTADYTGPYDVAEVQQSSFTGSGRIYLGHKATATTTYYNDAPIACVQILSSSNTLLQTWVFNTSTGGSGSGWQTYTSQSAAQTTGLPVTPSTVSGYTYTSISTSTNVGRFSWSTGTGSSYTGAADGIATPTVGMTVGNAVINQSAGTYYMFRETSGSTLNTTVFCRSPAFTFSGGEKIRIAHALTGLSTVPQNPDEALWIGIA